MWIVNYALRHPYTIAVLAILLVLLGGRSVLKISSDILPSIDVPYVNVLWTYPGLNAGDMAAKIASFSEIAIMNNVDDIKAVESENANGFSLIRVAFQPGVDIDVALSQITSVSQTILKRLPQGMTPPLVVSYSTSSVPILQLALSSDSMSESQLYDYARLTLRSHIQSIQGVRLSLPYGGSSRQIMVDLDPKKLQAYGLTPKDVSDAVVIQNLTLPSGSLREYGRDVSVSLNASPVAAEEFNRLPLTSVDGRVVFLRDVAHVRDGGAVQSNIARLDGASGVMVSLLKLGNASTVDIVDAVMERLPEMRASAPPGVRIEPIFDQSNFVRAAVNSVLAEAVLVAALVGIVVMLFLGSPRSTIIVLTSIPLALLAAITGLYVLGHTFNLMTLGGLGLAIGILVDNALVEIENINRNVDLGKTVRQAVIDSARQVVFPEFVSTLCICIVLLPIFLLTGISAYVFSPLVLSVVLAMGASFLLSRTLVPTMAFFLLPGEISLRKKQDDTLLNRLHKSFNVRLDRFRELHLNSLRILLNYRKKSLLASLLVAVMGVGTGFFMLGRDFFPISDAGSIRLHLRVEEGARVEETANLFSSIQRDIRSIIPPGELRAIVENIGVPDPINMSWISSLAVTSSEGEMLIQLNPGHSPTTGYIRQIRELLQKHYPDVSFLFRPADIISQTLNGTAAAAIEARISGRDREGNLRLARELQARTRSEVPGAVDVELRQITDWPDYHVQIDRVRAAQLGVTPEDVAESLLVALSSSATVQPSNWSDGGITYIVAVQVPTDRMRSRETILNTAVLPGDENSPAILLRNVASIKERTAPASISRSMLSPLYSVLIGIDSDADLGSVYREVASIAEELQSGMPPGNRIVLQGQAASMIHAYGEITLGLLFSAVLVYLVMVVNFQSWGLPLAALGAMPLAISGAMLGLWLTQTSLSVSALMGTIMVMGVSTANSVLVVSFARQLLLKGVAAEEACLAAIRTRLRPVLMTATAMLVGMVPMALALGEGGEQNAPLARAVIGGLLLGTPGTLTIVPLLVSLRRRPVYSMNPGQSIPEISVV